MQFCPQICNGMSCPRGVSGWVCQALLSLPTQCRHLSLNQEGRGYKISLESPFSFHLQPFGLLADLKARWRVGALGLGIGLWPSFPGRDRDGGFVVMKVLGWGSPKPRQRQSLGAESPFGRRSQKTGAREWGSDTIIRGLPRSTSK